MLLYLMLAALPIGLAALSTWQRRRPGSWLARWTWLVRVVAAAPYLALGAHSYFSGARVAGGLYMAAGLALIVFGAMEKWLEVDGRR